MRLLALFALIGFALDQGSKFAVVFGMNLISRLSIDVLPPYLNFRMGWNTGINFGLFGGEAEVMRWALVALALVLSTALIVWARRSFTRRIEFAAAGLIVGGALGNAVDRVAYGAVADFLNMSCCGISNPYTFNMADVFIFAGAFALVLWGGEKKTP